MQQPAPLSEAFMARPGRFRLLRKGVNRAGWIGNGLRLLEPGCSVGDASAWMAEDGFDVTAFDLSDDLIAQAVRKHGGRDGLHFVCADAAALPFADASFDGLYCEAAFSPMRDKARVLREYCRVLRPDGLVLMNDFVIRNEATDDLREEVVHIPCFAGVQTRACYEELFRKAGFEPVSYYEEYGELIGLTAWLCRYYQVSPDEIGGYLSMYFHSGATEGDACGRIAEEDPSGAEESQGSFFKRSELSYCQMIFRKKG